MKILKWISTFSLIVFCVAFFGSKLFLSYMRSPLDSLQQPTVVTVKPGASFVSVAEKLAEQGVWQQPELFSLWLRLFDPEFVLKAGEYRLPAHASPRVILDILGSGVSLQYKVTLLEGENIHQMLARLSANDVLQMAGVAGGEPQSKVLVESENVLSTIDRIISAKAKEYMQGDTRTEGWFLPDTYFFSKGDSLDSVLHRAHQAMLEVLAQEWQARDKALPYESAYQALIMASLIEKETGVAYERPQIAGVFVRRLQKRMRLQTDPTVIYGMGDSYSGNLRRADLKRDNEFNTYTRHGLPPTPIAMPGRAAINAALHPEPGSSLYFVAKGDGSHYFSDSLDEHLDAVRKYQLQRRADYRSAPKT